MARKPRVHVEGGFYHVILRGNGGDTIFFSDQDRYYFLKLIYEGIDTYGHRLHTYCLMPNHIHLVIQVGTVSLSKIVHNFSFRYTRYVNKINQRTGHLFQGRYKAILIDEEKYLLELMRYLHNNPISAGLVDAPGKYKWSSYNIFAGSERNPYVTTFFTLGHFSANLSLARKLFIDFVEKKDTSRTLDEIHQQSKNDRVSGDDEFIGRVLAKQSAESKPALKKVVEVVCRSRSVSHSELFSSSRKRDITKTRYIICWLVTRMEISTLSNLSTILGRDLATLSRGVQSVEVNRKHSERVRNELDLYLGALT